MIDVVLALILEGKKFLVVRPEGKEWFFLPGGRKETNESHGECLAREIHEELSVAVKEMRHYRDYETGGSSKIRARVYLCEIEGSPKPANEIEEIAWIDRNYDISMLGNVLKIAMPQMIEEGIL